MGTVTICSDFGAPQNKIVHCFHFFPFICYEVMGPDAMILVFWMLSFKPAFSLSSFTFIKRFFRLGVKSRLLGEISTTSDTQMITTLMAGKWEFRNFHCESTAIERIFWPSKTVMLEEPCIRHSEKTGHWENMAT